MSKIQFQYDIQNLTPANAQPVEANFTKVEQHINQELIERDGTVAMRAQLKLVGDPVASLDAAPKQYVDQVLPVGLIMMWGAAAVPANGRWLMCDGAPLQTATYPELFAVIGYAWGGAGGSFNTPNLGGRFPIGVGGAHAIAQTGGSEDSSLPAHAHDISHTHGGATTSTFDHNHYHEPQSHGHGVSIWSGDEDTNHIHFPDSGQQFLMNGPGSGGSAFVATAAPGGSYAIGATAGVSAHHKHAINGDTATTSIGTGWVQPGLATTHNHTFQPPTFNGGSNQQGVAPTGTNMPPFLAVPYIIRCR